MKAPVQAPPQHTTFGEANLTTHMKVERVGCPPTFYRVEAGVNVEIDEATYQAEAEG